MGPISFIERLFEQKRKCTPRPWLCSPWTQDGASCSAKTSAPGNNRVTVFGLGTPEGNLLPRWIVSWDTITAGSLHEISGELHQISLLNGVEVTDGYLPSPPLPSSLLSSPFPPTFSVRMQPCSTITAGSRHLDKVAIDLCWVRLLQGHHCCKIILGALHVPRTMEELFYSLLARFIASLWGCTHSGTADESTNKFSHPVLQTQQKQEAMECACCVGGCLLGLALQLIQWRSC